MFPPFLKPLAGKLIGGLDRRVKEGVRYMRLLVEERMALSAQYSGKHADKPVRKKTFPVTVVLKLSCRTICFSGSWMKSSLASRASRTLYVWY